MKNIILTLITFISLNTAMASERSFIEAGDKALGRAHVEIVDQSPICPRTPGLISCLAYGSKLQLKVTLNGCLDRLGPVFHHVEIKKHKAIVFIAAVNIHTEDSEVTKCIAAPMEFKTITVPFEGRIELRNMAIDGEVLPSVDPIFEPKL